MDIKKLIEQLRSYTYWLGQDGPESHDIHPIICDDAATALSTLQAENEKLRADVVRFNDMLASYQNVLVPELRSELEQVKRERDAAQSLLAERIGVRGAEPITTAFGLPIDRLRELAEADREGRCVVLPCKIFDKVWNIAGHYQFEVTEIDLLPYGNILFRCGNKGTDDYAAFYGDDLGDTFSLEEPPERNNRADAEAALRREQDD